MGNVGRSLQTGPVQRLPGGGGGAAVLLSHGEKEPAPSEVATAQVGWGVPFNGAGASLDVVSVTVSLATGLSLRHWRDAADRFVVRIRDVEIRPVDDEPRGMVEGRDIARAISAPGDLALAREGRHDP